MKTRNYSARDGIDTYRMTLVLEPGEAVSAVSVYGYLKGRIKNAVVDPRQVREYVCAGDCYQLTEYGEHLIGGKRTDELKGDALPDEISKIFQRTDSLEWRAEEPVF